MKFNQTVWDALCFLRNCGWESMASQALDAYAADCDGKVQWEMVDGRYAFRFIPNPIPKY